MAILKDAPVKILGSKEFQVRDMFAYSDPSMSPLNYKILGEYYRQLTDKWWNGEDWQSLNTTDYLLK